ncbi:hypothetical protein FVE85_4673 [Porphyridium purpureum]|uniref:Transcription factor IIIC subunit 5 HTH domain-containing protein n=1 Tax=Porphyridium purpureum TaxID=35688 RepID=A0A5J4YQI8_PORPP|nr:hypothetical protein FVE85_4673 [Porphyridium purpureum]|eukprot:POR1039..scf236_6
MRMRIRIPVPIPTQASTDQSSTAQNKRGGGGVDKTTQPASRVDAPPLLQVHLPGVLQDSNRPWNAVLALGGHEALLRAYEDGQAASLRLSFDAAPPRVPKFETQQELLDWEKRHEHELREHTLGTRRTVLSAPKVVLYRHDGSTANRMVALLKLQACSCDKVYGYQVVGIALQSIEFLKYLADFQYLTKNPSRYSNTREYVRKAFDQVIAMYERSPFAPYSEYGMDVVNGPAQSSDDLSDLLEALSFGRGMGYVERDFKVPRAQSVLRPMQTKLWERANDFVVVASNSLTVPTDILGHRIVGIKQKPLIDHLPRMQALLGTQPKLWTQQEIESHFASDSSLVDMTRKLLRFCVYTFEPRCAFAPPLLIPLGVDPRKDAQVYRVYQLLKIRVENLDELARAALTIRPECAEAMYTELNPDCRDRSHTVGNGSLTDFVTAALEDRAVRGPRLERLPKDASCLSFVLNQVSCLQEQVFAATYSQAFESKNERGFFDPVSWEKLRASVCDKISELVVEEFGCEAATKLVERFRRRHSAALPNTQNWWEMETDVNTSQTENARESQCIVGNKATGEAQDIRNDGDDVMVIETFDMEGASESDE